jgi:hypothetical protein
MSTDPGNGENTAGQVGSGTPNNGTPKEPPSPPGTPAPSFMPYSPQELEGLEPHLKLTEQRTNEDELGGAQEALRVMWRLYATARAALQAGRNAVKEEKAERQWIERILGRLLKNAGCGLEIPRIPLHPRGRLVIEETARAYRVAWQEPGPGIIVAGQLPPRANG